MEGEGRYLCSNCGDVYPGFVDKCSSCGSTKMFVRWIPCKETENKGFQMDDFDNIRIVVDDKKGEWSTYQSIACLKIDDKYYIGVSSYFAGCLPHECILKVEKVSD